MKRIRKALLQDTRRQGHNALLALTLLPLLCWGTPAIRIDDSATVVSQPILAMNWRQLVPGRGADHSVIGQVRADVKLNLARWINQSVRVYMVLPPLNGVPVEARWTTTGRLLPGVLRSGERALVFTGTVRAVSLNDALELILTTDGRRLVSPQSLQFNFELESP
jgi:hypothetical protein